MLAQFHQPGGDLVGGLAGDVVDQVADGGQVLGDAVVDLPRQPLPLVDGRQAAHVVEQEGGGQPRPGLDDDLLAGGEGVVGQAPAAGAVKKK